TLEVIEDRAGLRSTIITSQLPIAAWHQAMSEPTIADAVLDRVLSNLHRIELQGESMRRPEGVSTTADGAQRSGSRAKRVKAAPAGDADSAERPRLPAPTAPSSRTSRRHRSGCFPQRTIEHQSTARSTAPAEGDGPSNKGLRRNSGPLPEQGVAIPSATIMTARR
ncbi:MAG: hypothetical protein QOH80_1079, partial [Actinomycetota bacterium]|nr:hypothetical protein [Actinomycetota bacterium]